MDSRWRSRKLKIMIKKIVVIVGIIGLLGGVYAYMQFNKEHRDVKGEEAALQITAVDLFNAYVEDEKSANSLYLDKVMAITGTVIEVDTDNLMVVLETNDDFGTVNAQFDSLSDLENIAVSQEVVIKGRCTGGDDLGVVVTQCSILK